MRGATAEASTPVGALVTDVTAITRGNTREFLSWQGPGLDGDSHTNSFVAKVLGWVKKATTNVNGAERHCVHCTFCEDVCPAGVPVYHVWRLAQGGMEDDTYRFGVTSCDDCGLCTYVCPVKIPLSDWVSHAKHTLVTEFELWPDANVLARLATDYKNSPAPAKPAGAHSAGGH
jgi:Na+-transporting NADH:ubiquinone oxidoreductase subunit NqrA